MQYYENHVAQHITNIDEVRDLEIIQVLHLEVCGEINKIYGYETFEKSYGQSLISGLVQILTKSVL